MVLMAGPGQISWKLVRSHLGVSRISMATPSEVLSVTGCEIGTVNPLGLPSPLRILADTNVFKFDDISIGSGIKGVAIIMRSSDLRVVIKTLEVEQFC